MSRSRWQRLMRLRIFPSLIQLLIIPTGLIASSSGLATRGCQERMPRGCSAPGAAAHHQELWGGIARPVQFLPLCCGVGSVPDGDRGLLFADSMPAKRSAVSPGERPPSCKYWLHGLSIQSCWMHLQSGTGKLETKASAAHQLSPCIYLLVRP